MSPEPLLTIREPSSANADAFSIDVEPPTDSKAILWTTGLRDLATLVGQPEAKVRPLMGKLLAAAQDADRVLAAIERAKQQRPADPIPWLMAAVKPRRSSKPKAEPAELPAECNGFKVPVVIDGVQDELGVGNLRFPDLPDVVLRLLLEGHEPDALYVAARLIARSGVDRMRSAGLLAHTVRSRARDRSELCQGNPFNLHTGFEA